MIKDTISLVTPQEAVKLAKKRPLQDDIDIVHEIYNEFFSGLSDEDVRKSKMFYTVLFWTTVWNAGRVQGIREERKRRRKAAERAAENGVAKCDPIKNKLLRRLPNTQQLTNNRLKQSAPLL